MNKKLKIECSAAMRELNEAVETADLLTDYQLDTCTVERLACVLETQEGCPFHAADLRLKLEAVERESMDVQGRLASVFLAKMAK